MTCIGESIAYFYTYLKDCRPISFDVSGKSLELAKSNHVDLSSFIQYDGISIPFRDDSFDVVFASFVFQHIPPEHRLKILRDLRRALKSGGLFIDFEHNPCHFLTVRAVKNCPLDENAILIKGKEFVGLVQRTGFDTVLLNYRIFFPALFKALRPPEKMLAWLPLGAKYVVCCRKHDY